MENAVRAAFAERVNSREWTSMVTDRNDWATYRGSNR